MKISEVMSTNVQYVNPRASLHEVAKKMAEMDCGFLPISSPDGSKLQGVITDRDITIRAVAEGLDPDQTTADQAMSEKVLYCFAEDDVESAADSMRQQRVYRLIVVSNREEKKLCGVISLGDILRHNQTAIANSVAKVISEKAA